MKNILHIFKKDSIPEILKRPGFIISIVIIAITLLFAISTIIYMQGTMLYFIYIISFAPLLVEIKNFYMKPYNVPVKVHVRNFVKPSLFLKSKYGVVLAIILVFSLSPFYLSPFLEYQMNDYSKSQSFQKSISDLSNQIILNSTDDYEKARNLYYWTNCTSKNIAGIYSKSSFIRIYPLHIYLTEPYYCIRLIEHQNPEWVIKSRCGACEEFSQTFMLLAHNANLTVRSVHNHGYDHNWDEVLIENEWIIVDPSMCLFDINPSYYEDNLSWVSTYIFAIYPNGTKEDITSRYTNVSNLTLRAIDEKSNPLSNANIFLFSNNHPIHKESNTTFQAKTNSNGEYLIQVGGGNYTLLTEKLIDGEMYSNKSSLIITENDDVYYDLILKKDNLYWVNRTISYIQHTINFIIISLYSLFLWISCVIYWEYKNLSN